MGSPEHIAKARTHGCDSLSLSHLLAFQAQQRPADFDV